MFIQNDTLKQFKTSASMIGCEIFNSIYYPKNTAYKSLGLHKTKTQNERHRHLQRFMIYAHQGYSTANLTYIKK